MQLNPSCAVCIFGPIFSEDAITKFVDIFCKKLQKNPSTSKNTLLKKRYTEQIEQIVDYE